MLEPSLSELCQALALESHKETRVADSAFEAAQRRHSFWSMIDLSASYQFRLNKGARAAFVRAETFAGVIHKLVLPHPSIEIIKELGDAVLLRSDSFREILELVLALDVIRTVWDATRFVDSLEFSHRSAATFGDAVTVNRTGGVDALGASIDRLARVSNDRNGTSGAFMTIDLACFEASRDILDEYEYISFGHVRTALGKTGEPALRLVDLAYDADLARGDRRHFAGLRSIVADLTR